jgi:hypothetical protein
MKKIEEKGNKEMIPLNEKLFDNFFVQELEHRLETDPLMVGSFVELDSSSDAECFCTCLLGTYSCGEN